LNAMLRSRSCPACWVFQKSKDASVAGVEFADYSTDIGIQFSVSEGTKESKD